MPTLRPECSAPGTIPRTSARRRTLRQRDSTQSVRGIIAREAKTRATNARFASCQTAGFPAELRHFAPFPPGIGRIESNRIYERRKTRYGKHGVTGGGRGARRRIDHALQVTVVARLIASGNKRRSKKPILPGGRGNAFSGQAGGLLLEGNVNVVLAVTHARQPAGGSGCRGTEAWRSPRCR